MKIKYLKSHPCILVKCFFIIVFTLFLIGCELDTKPGSQPPPPPTRRPTSTPARPSPVQQGVGSFSMSTADTRRPSSIAQSVSVFSGGAGGAFCEPNSSAKVTVWQANNDQIEIFPISPSDVSAGDITIHTCGWTSTGRLPVVITYPDGTKRNNTVQVKTSDNGGGLEAYMYLDLSRKPQLGSYQIKFDGLSRDMYANFKVVRPTSPRLYTLPNGDVVLWNFRSNESVSLYAYGMTNAYSGIGEFLAYQEFITDSEGTLYVDVKGNLGDAFVAIGTRTNQVVNYSPYEPVVIDNIKR